MSQRNGREKESLTLCFRQPTLDESRQLFTSIPLHQAVPMGGRLLPGLR